jgi:V/A-type H+-transporting ATPase subunit A
MAWRFDVKGPTHGRIVAVNGPLVTCEVGEGWEVLQNEVAYVTCGEVPLKAEVIRIRGRQIDLQVFESTTGLKVGNQVDFSSELLSATLGPGMLGMIYDGLQNPLKELENDQGFFLRRGQYLPALDQKKLWDFEPTVKAGAQVRPGHYLGQVTEGLFPHPIMAPLRLQGTWEVREIKPRGQYTVNDTIAILKSTDSSQSAQEVSVTMKQEWPVKMPMRKYEERLLPDTQLLTQCRLIDIFFPMAEGGTACIPGPFGAGKTVLQQIISRYAQTDIVIIVACGERAGEVVETIREFPELEDPKTGKSLMDRTVIICNTSSMPVAAREASIYTGITLGEYYRQLGLKVLLLADSTSRWAQALRESSARMEEIPGEEAFPAYLESRIAAVYERAGLSNSTTITRGH